MSFLVEMTGVEPVSEKKSAIVSPGADYLQNSLGDKPVIRPTLR